MGELALAFGKPFAVVPCCTFADDFPEGLRSDGKPVRTYDDIITWLQTRCTPEAEVEFLPFHGKNLVVHRQLRPAGATPQKAEPEEKRPRTEAADDESEQMM